MTENKISLSDWLVASDIDGTLNDKRRRLPKRNAEAIRKFVYEYGGNFILSSGRSIESMRKHVKNLKINACYAVFTNGAGVYDYANEKILWMSNLNEKTTEIVKKAAKKFPTVKAQILTADKCELVRPLIGSLALGLSSKLPLSRFSSIDKVPEGDWCKVIFVGTPWTLNRLQKYVTEINDNNTTNLMRSSPVSFEVVSEETNKGVAVLKVAEILGVDKSKTAAIGDYFNDYEMLKHVALPACCGQAPQGMKDIAKLVTCHCNKGAVADLIEYIIQNHDKF